ncbi:PREDICTED: LOW QUALITY PROTEIN: beta,beta-carotene 9',10'-oxygenase-like [Priapulus caudatus]|uniref:LOW QUALITY PROTEIN: beta,beta-carotene 9',10'-oxygenase-like n=1 Tax=Priapulus caudatus TaxID=37621 RepID=A0ABM1E876_PRICU|nr:PREDICTED: LOW QUALITY PROTEIN: beta,beta-carotene 9',10'-oxygenase-like [Priapulus caudatus]
MEKAREKVAGRDTGMEEGTEKVDPRDVLFRTVDEHTDVIEAKITGVIPKWISGNFIAVGPGKFEQGAERYRHYFDGMALLMRFEVRDQRVRYASKFLPTVTLTSTACCNIASSTMRFGTGATWVSYILPTNMSDNATVNLVHLGGELYCSGETATIFRINPDSLETLERVELKKLASLDTCVAHAQYDNDGSAYLLGSHFSPPSAYKFIKIPPPDETKRRKIDPTEPVRRAEVVAKVSMQNPLKPSYIHSFAMTDNYFIFVESPLVINILTVTRRKLSALSLYDALEWLEGKNCRIHLVERRSGKESKVRCECPPMLVIHQINAYEHDDNIILDVCCYDDATMLDEYHFEKLLDTSYTPRGLAEPRRLIIPISGATAAAAAATTTTTTAAAAAATTTTAAAAAAATTTTTAAATTTTCEGPMSVAKSC